MSLKTALRGNDARARRRAVRDALAEGTPVRDVAQVVVEEGNRRLLAGDTAFVDELMFDAVHDGVFPSALFEAIKHEAVRKFKEA